MATELNERDKMLLDLMKQFHIMDVKNASIYFNGKNKEIVTARRLKKLYEAKNNINRHREDILHGYVYYYNKRRSNYKHDLVRLNVYTALKLNPNIEIIKYVLEKEFIINNSKVRCDLLVIAKDKTSNKLIPLIIEIDLNKAYAYKYSNLDYKQYFPIKPTIISVGRYAPKDKDVIFIKSDEIEQLTTVQLS